MEMDWVKRKAIGEQFIEDHQEDVWKGLRNALQSAAESYSVHYGGVASGHGEGERHFRVQVQAQGPYKDALIDVTFAPPEVRVVCNRSFCKTSTFVLNPNKDAPFLNSEHRQLTIDQVSEAILRSIFFPAESRGVHTRFVAPCPS